MDPAVAEMVCHIRERIADRIGANPFRTWFGDSTEFELADDRLDVTVQSAFAGTWIAANYLPDMIEATRDIVGTELRVDVRVAENNPRTDCDRPRPSTSSRHNHKPSRAHEKSTLRGDLDEFVVGPSNELAYSAARSIVRAPGETFTPLVIHGGCGLGKTHLVQGICNAVRRAHPTLSWRYVSGEEFTNEFVYAVKGGRIDLFRARFRKVDLLVIDDIHFLANKKATQEEFLHTFNAIDTCGKAVVLSSDRHPRSIATLSEPLISRLIAGMVVEIVPPDFATRREILRRRTLAVRSDVPEDVIDYVARHVTRNVRELEGALFKLVAVASLTKERITLDLARSALADYVVRSERRPEATEIERTVADRFGVTREQIHSKARDRTISLARAVAMYLIRKHTSMSFPEIGRAIGNKNHSTVLMATRRIERILEQGGAVFWKSPSGIQDAPLRTLLENIERDLVQQRD